jgi:hypothetical protein
MGRGIPVKPIDVNELFELNPDYEVVSFDGEVMIIDNWYKNYDQIIEVMKEQTPALFNPGSDDGKNGVDYYDGRVLLTNTHNNVKYGKTFEEIEKIIKMPLSVSWPQALIFNYWKNIKVIPKNIQASPHTDKGIELACVIYLDEVCSGGTMLYDASPTITDGSGTVDINNFKHTYEIKPKKLIEAKPNRMVIYPGNVWHGAYIEDHSKYVDEWRINQVHFINVDNNKNNKE